MKTPREEYARARKRAKQPADDRPAEYLRSYLRAWHNTGARIGTKRTAEKSK